MTIEVQHKLSKHTNGFEVPTMLFEGCFDTNITFENILEYSRSLRLEAQQKSYRFRETCYETLWKSRKYDVLIYDASLVSPLGGLSIENGDSDRPMGYSGALTVSQAEAVAAFKEVSGHSFMKTWLENKGR